MYLCCSVMQCYAEVAFLTQHFCLTELTYRSRCYWAIELEIDQDVFEFMKEMQ